MFMKLVLHNQRNQSEKGCVIPFHSKFHTRPITTTTDGNFETGNSKATDKGQMIWC